MDEKSVALIKNEDDRIVLKEVYEFEENRCRVCQVFSPQGILISKQKMLYTHCGDSYDEVILFDAGDRPVMSKRYEIDEQGNFAELLSEDWENHGH